MPKKKTQDLPVDIIALQRSIYLDSFYEFCKEAFKALHNGEYDDNWHIKYICDVLQREVERMLKKQKRKKHLIINVPPRSSKSMVVSVIFPVWAMLKLGKVDIISATHSNNLAEDLSARSRDLIESEWFQDRFGLDLILRKDSNSKSDWSTTKGGHRMAFGLTSKFIGKNADIVICDDLQDSDTADSPADRVTTINKFTKSLSTRLNNKATGLIINIQQRLHVEDVTGWILENLGEYYDLIKIPSEAQSEFDVSPAEIFQYYQDGLFWNKSGRFSRADLEIEKKVLGSRGYSQLHLQRPKALDEGVFKTGWFSQISETEFLKAFLDAGKKPVYNFYLDTAYTAEAKNDASALIVAAYLGNKLYIKDAVQVRKEFQDLVKWLKSYLPKYYSGESRVYIEAKASGISLIQQLRSEGGFNVIPMQTGKDSKLTRALKSTAFVEGGNVSLVKGDYIEEFLDQVTSFKDGKSGGHDDLLDAFVYSVLQRKSGSFFWAFS